MKHLRRHLAASLTVASIILFISTAGAEKLGNAVLWVKSSAAYRCCVQQAYSNAMARLERLAKGKKPGTWCVVLDADETVISNVRFQADIQRKGEEFSKEAWTAWCEQAASKALPGAKEFCALAKKLGGRVIIVTNRKEPPLRAATVKNLKEQGIPFDLVLLREGPYAYDRSKRMRREDIRKGTVKTLPPGVTLPPLEIVMKVGDQTHDIYDSEKLSFKDVKDRFAEDLVIIPNPMYGDWQREEKPSPAPAPSAAKATRSSGAISWQAAMKKVGEEVVVEDAVVKVYIPPRGPAKLNFTSPWWKGLTVVVFNADRFGDLKRFEGKIVRVSGRVTTWTSRSGRKTIQIKISDPSQIEIVK